MLSAASAPSRRPLSPRPGAGTAALALTCAWGCGCSLWVDETLANKPAETTSGGAVSTSSSGSGTAGGCGQGCASNEACCHDACVDVLANVKACGACDKACPGTACLGGECTSQCLFGLDNCDGNLVTNGCEIDLTSDPAHCGSCGGVCPPGALCKAGVCTCAAGAIDCDGVGETGCEIDGLGDPLNCGSCGAACGPHQSCAAGKCACTAGHGDCNGDANDGCEAPLDTVANCLGCGAACGPNMVCDAAAGGCACDPTHLDCNSAAGCESSKTSAGTCGSCGTQCGLTKPLCNGVECVLACGAGAIACGNACVDPLSDPLHCGGCNQATGPGQHCEGGARLCDAGRGDCDGQAVTGCEVDLGTDAAHCGTCATVCKPGAVCAGGACVCGASTPNDCGAECRVCCSSSDCSDGNGCTTDVCAAGGAACESTGCGAGAVCCGQLACHACCSDQDCDGGTVCSGDVCIAPCAGGLVACTGQCVDLASSAAHCGACDNDCLAGRTCDGGVCTPAWVVMGDTAGAPAAREGAAAVWTGSALFVWGGKDVLSDRADGGLYDPTTDTWTTIPVELSTPSGRSFAAAVWTGASVLVWGGGPAIGSSALGSGGRYSPQTGTWTSTSSAGAPAGRRAPILVWTGTRALLWGGSADGQPVGGGALYDPTADTWTSIAGGPSARAGAATAWSGTELYVVGGSADGVTELNDGYAYDPAKGTWRSLPAGGAPSARRDAFALWLAGRLVVWGGRSGGGSLDDGARYEPLANLWSPMTTQNRPSKRSRSHAKTGWVGAAAGRGLVFGGVDGVAVKKDGRVYDVAADVWSNGVSATKDHNGGAFAWTGAEMFLWSGRDGSVLDGKGERYKP